MHPMGFLILTRPHDILARLGQIADWLVSLCAPSNLWGLDMVDMGSGDLVYSPFVSARWLRVLRALSVSVSLHSARMGCQIARLPSYAKLVDIFGGVILA